MIERRLEQRLRIGGGIQFGLRLQDGCPPNFCQTAYSEIGFRVGHGFLKGIDCVVIVLHLERCHLQIAVPNTTPGTRNQLMVRKAIRKPFKSYSSLTIPAQWSCAWREVLSLDHCVAQSKVSLGHEV